VATYIEGHPTKKPSLKKVVSGLELALKGLNLENRTAGKVNKFVKNEFSMAMKGLDSLIDRLQKASKTLNPQDDAKQSLEHSISGIQGAKASLIDQFGLLSQIDI